MTDAPQRSIETSATTAPHGDEPTEARSHRARWIGLFLAPLLALSVWLLLPEEFVDAETGDLVMGATGRIVAAIGVFMATLWVTEALPIPATALLPLALLPLLTMGEIAIGSAAAPYANPIIFLFMGGFMIALTMERWGLHRRIALHIVLLVGTKPIPLIGGFMIASAFLSMWVSNTATVVMMLPIATTVIALVRRELKRSGDPNLPAPGEPFNFALCLLLGTAYGASIGGVGTPIGSPPNAILIGYMDDNYGIKITFAMWLGIGVPVVIILLPIAWFILTRLVYPIRIPDIPGGRALIQRELREQGLMSRAELAVLIVFSLTAAAWIFQPWLKMITIGGIQPLAGLSDPMIAIGAALVLFGLPIDWKRGVFLLTWEQAVKLPWGTLILFGGGLSLAGAVTDSGLAAYIGSGVAALEHLPTPLLVLAVVTLLVFLTELTSNTATIATFLPILAAVAIAFGLDPLVLALPATVAVSLAFMMPVATPPNAIVFGTGELTIPQMCKAGFWLNLVSIMVVMLVIYFIVLPIVT